MKTHSLEKWICHIFDVTSEFKKKSLLDSLWSNLIWDLPPSSSLFNRRYYLH